MWKSICIWAVVQWWMREIFLNWKIKKFSIPRTSFVVLGNLLGKTPIFQALRYWKILFSPSDFEPTSVRNCQFLTLPVRNCQHADPYQVLGLERSEQQCVLDTRRHQPTPTRCWGLNNLPEDFSNINCFHFTRCAENLANSKEWKTLPIARNGVLYLVKGFSARRLELKTLSCPCVSQDPCCTCIL